MPIYIDSLLIDIQYAGYDLVSGGFALGRPHWKIPYIFWETLLLNMAREYHATSFHLLPLKQSLWEGSSKKCFFEFYHR